MCIWILCFVFCCYAADAVCSLLDRRSAVPWPSKLEIG
jgi:hypothetical protein